MIILDADKSNVNIDCTKYHLFCLYNDVKAWSRDTWM